MAAEEKRKSKSSSHASLEVDLESSPNKSSENSPSKDSPVDSETDLIFPSTSQTAPPAPKRLRASKDVITPNLVSCMDRTKVSDRKAVYFVTECARALGQDPKELNINRTTIQRKRIQFREEIARNLKEEFKDGGPLVVHWDGKLMRDLTTKEHVDRLPILVSGQDVQQLLHVAKLPNGTGQAMAHSVVRALKAGSIFLN